MSNHSSFLLEIGTEEIPARFLPPAIAMLKENTEAILNEYLIEYSDIRTYATPRRLALLVKGIHQTQKDRIREIFGPSKKTAFDERGNPTKAAVGFANSQGIDVSDLIVKTKDKGEYVAAVLHQKGAAVKELLPEALKKIIRSLHFQKSMRWGNGRTRFVRPIHWILALHDTETVQFDIDGIQSGNATKGHRFLSPGYFVIRDIPSYVHLLANNYVIVDQDERRRIISEGITRLASSVRGKAVKDECLLDTVTYLVEYPIAVLCEFPADYLGLPRELLTTVMKGHQKYFGIEDEAGNLKNYFIAISNTKDENSGTVRVGAERVTKARFEDARFYYGEDIGKPLQSRMEGIKKVTFHDKLGTLYEKTERIVKLSSFLSERLFPEKSHSIERAGWLCKTDLITGVVGEFPELQGLMGGYYARHHGESKEVADAITEHYLPSHPGDRLPDTDEGSVISLADKTDNIVSFFGIGITPTGSEDPFALRRQAIAVILILFRKSYNISLNEIIGKAIENTGNPSPSLSGDSLNFFIQRIESIFSSQGHDIDIIQSVLNFSGNMPLSGLIERMQAIKEFKTHAGYNEFLLAMKRINNIIPKTDLPALRRELLMEPQEKTLYNNTMHISSIIYNLLDKKEYRKALSLFSTLTESINNFFDNVMVMDNREDIRLNRLALLKETWDTASCVADFSKLAEIRANKLNSP